MAGPLKTHPYYKSFDELQRTVRRMENYLNINTLLLDPIEQNKIRAMIENIYAAIERIPEEYRLTKHEYQNK